MLWRVGQWTYWCLSSTIQRRELTCCTQMVLVACILVYIMGWVPWKKKRLWDEEEQTGTFQKQDWAEGEVELWYISAEVPANFLESSQTWDDSRELSWGEPGTRSMHFTLINLSDPSHPRKEVWPWVRQLSSAEARSTQVSESWGFWFQHLQRPGSKSCIPLGVWVANPCPANPTLWTVTTVHPLGHFHPLLSVSSGSNSSRDFQWAFSSLM